MSDIIKFVVAKAVLFTALVLSPSGAGASCLTELQNQQQQLAAMQEKMAGEASVCGQCRMLSEGLESFQSFLQQCPEADPTGEDRMSVAETLKGAVDCVRQFC